MHKTCPTGLCLFPFLSYYREFPALVFNLTVVAWLMGWGTFHEGDGIQG